MSSTSRPTAVRISMCRQHACILSISRPACNSKLTQRPKNTRVRWWYWRGNADRISLAGAVKRVGRCDAYATEFDLEAEEYVPLPKGDVHKKKAIVQVCLAAACSAAAVSLAAVQ